MGDSLLDRVTRLPFVIPGDPTGVPASVLLALAPVEGTDDLELVLVQRPDHLRHHAGQVGLPGGAVEPEDADGVAAALREAHEEVGLDPAAVEVIGRLDRVVTPTTGFVLTPFVGVLGRRPVLRAGPAEVEEAFDVPLSVLLDPAVFREERWDRPVPDRPVYFFELERDTVWGVTARILYRLLQLVTGRTERPEAAPPPGRAGTRPPARP
jgi:8-oxo-dGTP pyrophosphatase MutT (NUDIX family)